MSHPAVCPCLLGLNGWSLISWKFFRGYRTCKYYIEDIWKLFPDMALVLESQALAYFSHVPMYIVTIYAGWNMRLYAWGSPLKLVYIVTTICRFNNALAAAQDSLKSPSFYIEHSEINLCTYTFYSISKQKSINALAKHCSFFLSRLGELE